MVCFLVLIEMLDILGRDIACPLKVEELIFILQHSKTSCFASVHYRIVNVSAVWNFESHKKIFHFFALILSDPIALFLNFNVGRVLEKGCGSPVCEYGFKKGHFGRGRFEDGVGKSALLSPYKSRIDRILIHKHVDLVNNLIFQAQMLIFLSHLIQSVLCNLGFFSLKF
jgi:hypothetical protein